ncbi:MAG: aldehyde dehydrogenase family protein, partial [Actinobacteria bacterium]|nr:aldehyde dehydrogenase family protein [Actinomycetota bacterium]
MKKRMLAALVGLSVGVLVVHDIPLASYLRKVETDRYITGLERDSFILVESAHEAIEEPSSLHKLQLQDDLNKYVANGDATVLVTDRQGLAIAATSSDILPGDDFSTRPEIEQALQGKVASGRRYSNTLPIKSSEFANDSNADPTDLDLVNSLERKIANVLSQKHPIIPIVINGAECKSIDFESGIDPNDNGKIWYQYAVATEKEVEVAVKTAKSAVENWNSLGAAARAKLLQRCAEVMNEQRLDSIAIMTRDAGKTFAESDPEVSEAIDFANFYAVKAANANFDSDSTPTGVVVVVPPWNFPYSIPAGGILAALAAGNSVIFKSAPETVATSWKLVNQIWQAGISKEVLQFVSTRDD